MHIKLSFMALSVKEKGYRIKKMVQYLQPAGLSKKIEWSNREGKP